MCFSPPWRVLRRRWRAIRELGEGWRQDESAIKNELSWKECARGKGSGFLGTLVQTFLRFFCPHDSTPININHTSLFKPLLDEEKKIKPINNDKNSSSNDESPLLLFPSLSRFSPSPLSGPPPLERMIYWYSLGKTWTCINQPHQSLSIPANKIRIILFKICSFASEGEDRIERTWCGDHRRKVRALWVGAGWLRERARC